MTSAQLILVSVSSALIAVIAMLVVATVLRARTRESTGGDVSQPTGSQTRAQRAATRAQKRAQRATIKAERKAAKAAASVTKAERAKADKDKAAAPVAAKTEPTDDKAPSVGADDAPADKDAKRADTKEDASSAAAQVEGASGESPGSASTEAAETSGTPGETDVLAVPEKKEDEVATTEAGRKASEAKPKARKSLLGRRRADDSPEEKS
jgi:hypothetical protein